jgi:hypothetical protein
VRQRAPPGRKRKDGTIGELAAQEELLALPAAALPALLEALRVVSRTAMVAFEANGYSVRRASSSRT